MKLGKNWEKPPLPTDVLDTAPDGTPYLRGTHNATLVKMVDAVIKWKWINVGKPDDPRDQMTDSLQAMRLVNSIMKTADEAGILNVKVFW